MRGKKRPSGKASERPRLALGGMQGGVDISELRRRRGIDPTVYSRWTRKLLLSAVRVFDEKSRKQGAERGVAEREMAPRDYMPAEITAKGLDSQNGPPGQRVQGDTPREPQECA